VSLLPARLAESSAAARDAADAARQAGARAAVEVATAGGARLARAADRAGPLLDRLDDTMLPVTEQGLETVVGAAAATSRAALTQVLRLAVRARLLRPALAAGRPSPTSAAPGGPLGVVPVGRAVLERGARIAVLGLVSMIVLSTAAALLPWVSGGQPVAELVAPPRQPSTLPAAAPSTTAPSITVGKFPGDSVATYIGIADQALTQLAGDAPDADLVALVDLTGYRSPAQLHALLLDYRVTQVFFAVPGAGPVHQAAVRDPVADVFAAFDAQAAAAARQAAAAPDPAAAVRDRAEAGALRAHCACAFAAVVRAPAARLVGLRESQAVRLIDPAAPGAVESTIRFVPVTPEQR
jgi:hypothetical protein